MRLARRGPRLKAGRGMALTRTKEEGGSEIRQQRQKRNRITSVISKI